MKKLRNTLITSFLVIALFTCLMITLGGCVEAFGAGVVTGSAVTHTLEGAEKDIQLKTAALIEEQKAIAEQIESANDEAEKAALIAKNKALSKQIELMASAGAGVDVAQEAIGTDWTDPDQYAPWVISAVLAALGYMQSKEKRSVSQVLKAVSEGVEKFKAQSDPTTAEALYTSIKERKAKNKVE